MLPPQIINVDKTTWVQVEALIAASKVQSERVNIISANLPARLPRPANVSVQGVTLAAGRSGTLAGGRSDTAHAGEAYRRQPLGP
jgi:hypothetical protein